MRTKSLIFVILLSHLILAQCEQNTIDLLVRQMMAMQTNAEETLRASSGSGIKQVRVLKGGTRPYYFDDHTGSQMSAIHNHANNINTLGMGEVIAVLNGVQFRTRHNDYKLMMPHSTLNGFEDSEPIPFPEVPPSVSKLRTVTEQIAEMRQYFKAFKQQDTSIRGYKPYFKPVLCYMEGAWMSSTDSIEEPFDSDRHHIDAASWSELLSRVEFFAYTGGKNTDENIAFLPVKINEVMNGTVVLAQWNYRIRCAPVSLDSDKGLNFDKLRMVDDLTTRMANENTFEEHEETRAARFQLGRWRKGKTGRQSELKTTDTVLDALMEQIPGYDNYNRFIADNDFGSIAVAFNGSVLNSAYYHRIYKVNKKDAMGLSARRRSFSDQNVFMAQNYQSKVPGAWYSGCSTDNKMEVCRDVRQKWSWAIPLEIVYLTPLLSWNPYNLPFRDDKTVARGGRNGGLTPDKALDGTSKRAFFRTPKEFFSDDKDSNTADTGNAVVGVLDSNGVVRQVRSSGTRIFIPPIPDVGTIRTRWPIAPLSDEGNQIRKELEALKDIVLRMSSYSDMLREIPPGSGDDTPVTRPPPSSVELNVDETFRNPPGQHSHSFTLTQDDIEMLASGDKVVVETSENMGHSHSLLLKLNWNHTLLKIGRCDRQAECWDGHPEIVSEATKLIKQYSQGRR